jgi:hypothetical protein
VIGVDPEPEMLAHAAAEADRQGRTNLCWTLGSDGDLDALTTLLGAQSVGAVVIGNAIHLMDCVSVFRAARSLIGSQGGVALLANSTPLWQQDSACSRALRLALEDWFDTELTSMCGMDRASRCRYAAALRNAGYVDVTETVLREYEEDLDAAWVIGHLYSAIPQDELPAPGQREAFEQRIKNALAPTATFTEHVRVSVLSARSP